jgi:hypothetical protein
VLNAVYSALKVLVGEKNGRDQNSSKILSSPRLRSDDLRHYNEANALSIENTDTNNQGIL